MEDGKILIKAQIDSSEVDSGMKNVEGKVTKSANNLAGIVKGVGFAALFAKASQMAIKFAKDVNTATEAVEAKLKAASTLYQGVAVNQEALLGNLSKISSETGASLETLGQSVYDALSAGVKPTEDMSEVLKVVSASAKLAKGGFTDTSTALSATMKVMNAYGKSMNELDKVQGVLMQTQNSGITTVDELGASLAQVVPTAASFGVSFENVGAAIAEMTKQGTKTAVATTSLNAIIAELGKNGTTASKNLKAAAESAGLSTTSFGEMLDSGMSLADILEVMSDYADENGLSMVDMFSSIDAGKASLQLTGKAGNDFNEIMGKMGESAGLVEEAFNKTVDPSERLSSAWNTLLVTLGDKFKPKADGLRNTLADMVTTLAGQRTKSDELSTATQTLIAASKDLKGAQEKAKTAIDDTTDSLIMQSRINYSAAMKDISKAYDASVKSIKKMDSEIADFNYNIRAETDDLTKLYTQYVKLFGAPNEDENWISKTLELDDKAIDASQKKFKGTVIQYVRTIEEFKAERDELQEEQNKAIEQNASTFKALAQAVKDGDLSLDQISLWSPELKERVVEATVAMEKEAEAAKAVGEAAAEAGKEAEGANAGGNPDDIKETTDDYKELQKEIEEVHTKYQRLDEAAKATGNSFYEDKDVVSDLTDIYIKYVEKGIDPTTDAMMALNQEIAKYTPTTDRQIELQKKLVEQVGEITAKYNNLVEASKEASFVEADNKDKVKELENLYTTFAAQGLPASCKGMRDLKKEIEDLGGSVNESKDGIKAFLSSLKDLADSSAESLAQGLGSAFESLVEDLSSAPAKVEELKKQIEDLKSEDGELAQAQADEAAAQAEYDLAQKRGDEVAIKNAEAKLKTAKAQVKAVNEEIANLESEKDSVESNTEAWSAFGKSSLEALASVIEGLAGQLAAQAISTYPNYAQMALSAAGATAAYFAAGMLRSQAQQFSTGGIVQGESKTGDHIMVGTNAGELILNTAQQETLARMLEASVALAELQTGNASSGITIYMDGATINGLDEPAVGKAIYDNIQTLRYEGVI